MGSSQPLVLGGHVHQFSKLNENAIWCKCGEIRTAPAAHVCYSWCNHYHWYTAPQPTVPPYVYPNWTISSSPDVASVTVWNG